MNEDKKAFLVAMALCLLVAISDLCFSASFRSQISSVIMNSIPIQATTPHATANSSNGLSLLMDNTSDEDRQDFWSKVYLAVTGIGALVAFAGFFASYKTNHYGNVVSSSQKLQIAQANARALEAAVELAKYKAPRVLNGEAIESIAVKLLPLAGQKYDLTVPPMLEPGSGLHTQIVAALCKAGWKLVPFDGPGPNRMDENVGFFAVPLPPEVNGKIVMPLPAKIGVDNSRIGILAGFEDGDSLRAHGELLQALASVGLPDVNLTRLSVGPLPTAAIPRNPSGTVVHLIIGRKN